MDVNEKNMTEGFQSAVPSESKNGLAGDMEEFDRMREEMADKAGHEFAQGNAGKMMRLLCTRASEVPSDIAATCRPLAEKEGLSWRHATAFDCLCLMNFDMLSKEYDASDFVTLREEMMIDVFGMLTDVAVQMKCMVADLFR